MRYLLALLCPPAALLACRRPRQAMAALILWLVGLASIGWGVGVVILFGCILWAANAVGDHRAAIDAARFIRTVKPIRTVRG